MPENEEIINENGGGGEAEVVVEQPVIQQWKIVPENEPTHLPTETAFKVVPEVEEVIETPEAIVETPIAEEVIENPIVEQVIEQPTIDEQKVLEYLKTQKGFKGEHLDDLSPKEERKLSATAEAFQKYVDETNNDSFEDFVALKKDWTTEPKQNVLKTLMKAERPYLSDSDIDLLIEDKYAIEELDEYATDSEKRENRLKEIAFEEDYQKGLTLLESQKEKYKIVRGSDDSLPEDVKVKVKAYDDFNKQQEENRIAYEKNVADFNAKTNSVFTKDFEGFEVNFGDEKTGFNKVVIKPEDIEGTKKELSDVSNFNKKFFDENGNIKDPKAYYRALYFGMNEEKITAHIWNTAQAKMAEDEEKESKNIKVLGEQSRNAPLINSGKKWTVEK